MLCRRMVLSWVVVAAGTLGSAGLAQAEFQPWSQAHLLNDSWIAPASPPADPTDPAQMLQINTVNGGSFPVGFDFIKLSDGSARGLNSLAFTDGTLSAGRLSGGAAGSFGVTAGGTKTYSDLLIMVAIDADVLPAGFAFSLGRQGQAPRTFDVANDFGFVAASADDAGRPSGYYSESNPAGSPLAYDFDRGWVTIMAFSDLPLAPRPAEQWFDYEFQDSPGKAVFSLYARVSGAAWIYHTNRDLPDNRAAGDVVTFEVAPEPASAAVLLVGAAGLLRRRRRP